MLNQPSPDGDRRAPKEAEVNLALVPDYVPENILELKTPSQAFRETFDRFGLDNNATEVSSRDHEALEIAGTLLTQFAQNFDAYTQGSKGKQNNLIFEVESTKHTPEGSLFMLVDVSDRFFGLIPGLKAPGSVPASALYEKMAAPIRHFAAIIPASTNKTQQIKVQQVIFTPLFNEESLAELFHHLADVKGYVENPKRSNPTNGRNVPIASFLFDQAMVKIEESLKYIDAKLANTPSVYKIEDIKSIDIGAEGNFTVTVLANQYSKASDKKEPIGSAEISFNLIAKINEYGFLHVNVLDAEVTIGNLQNPPEEMAA